MYLEDPRIRYEEARSRFRKLVKYNFRSLSLKQYDYESPLTIIQMLAGHVAPTVKCYCYNQAHELKASLMYGIGQSHDAAHAPNSYKQEPAAGGVYILYSPSPNGTVYRG